MRRHGGLALYFASLSFHRSSTEVPNFRTRSADRTYAADTVDVNPGEPLLADPPVGFGTNDHALYDLALDEVHREGGSPDLPSTHRKVRETVAGYFWAYDGAKLLGTPPRQYNRILRQIAWERKRGAATDEAANAEFARLFALANAAMGDAGVFAWLNKYRFEFWRPLSGIREDAAHAGRDPFWRTLGVPDTNSSDSPFKPPFPAYPSGHATFGGAFFQTLRLWYRQRDGLAFAPNEPDEIAFVGKSEELNGVSRDLYQPFDPNLPITDQQGLVRANVTVHFHSLWAAMFDNGISRGFLYVSTRSSSLGASPPRPPSEASVANGTCDRWVMKGRALGLRRVRRARRPAVDDAAARRRVQLQGPEGDPLHDHGPAQRPAGPAVPGRRRAARHRDRQRHLPGRPPADAGQTAAVRAQLGRR